MLLSCLMVMMILGVCGGFRSLFRPVLGKGGYKSTALLLAGNSKKESLVKIEDNSLAGEEEVIDERSAISLVAGTTIGAGVLALPNVSYDVGFFPSAVALIASWMVMTLSSLLMAEISTNLAKADSRLEGRSYLTLIGEVLGEGGGAAALVVYTLLHYALLVAYDSGAGDAFSRALGTQETPTIVAFAATMGIVCGFGGERTVNTVNNFFFALVIAAFISLIVIGLPAVSPSNLVETIHPERLIGTGALPVMVLAFVHHNVIPTVSRQLAYEKKTIQNAIVLGTSIPLGIFLMWNLVVLGIGPIQSIDSTEAFTDRSSFDTVGVLASVGGGENGGIVATELAELFSTAAVVTSFIGFFVGLSDLFRDYVGPKERPGEDESGKGSSLAIDLGIAAAITVPPAIIAIQNPTIFIDALDIAGTYGITVLFLVIPAVMSMTLKSRAGEGQYDSFVPLGNLPAFACIATAAGLILQKVASS